MDILLMNTFVTGDLPIQQGGNVDNQSTIKSPMRRQFISLVSMVCFVAALYLSYKRNNGFNAGSMLFAFCCSTLYLVWAFFNPIKKETGGNTGVPVA